MTLEGDPVGAVRFLICIKWYQSFNYFLAMARDDDRLQGISTRIGTIEGKISALESILNNVVQELKRLSLKIDDQGQVLKRTRSFIR